MIDPDQADYEPLLSAHSDSEQDDLELDQHQLGLDKRASESSKQKIANGNGILCGVVQYALGLSAPCQGFVKVSFVEPGPNDNVMFRSKQVIHETKPSSGLARQLTWNEEFEYEIFTPDGNDWGGLTGDILFTLYDMCDGQRNVFLGQVMIPLRELLDHNLHGGTQTRNNATFPLVSRNGLSKLSGSLSLELHLELPPDEPVSPGQIPVMDGATIDRKTQSIKSRVKQRKHSSSAKSKSKTCAQLQTERRKRDRENKMKNIDKENKAIHQRLESMKTNPSSFTTQTWRKLKSATIEKHPEQKCRSSSKNELLQLSDELEKMTLLRTNLEDEISKLKASISRDATILKRRSTVVNLVEEAENEYRGLNVVRKVKKRQNASNTRRYEPSSTTPAHLESIRKKALRAFNKFDDLSTRIVSATNAKESAFSQIEQARRDLKKIHAELQVVSSRQNHQKAQHQTMDLNKTIRIDDEVLRIQARQREVRVEIAVAKQTLEDFVRQGKMEEESHMKQQQELEGKLVRKKKRLQSENENYTKLSREYESKRVTVAKEVNLLRDDLERLQSALSILSANNKTNRLQR